eukprot:TRINITY_DN15378_c0_g2_i1.p1 TRINITY_DN15378_c0_g2~~TRINITY_DN15378_c0_g2_i1.p1  ORF type:complete len:474 (+),score=80.74 TRINITY_DN15378_c0_g2_i1:79-1500(+)
MWQRCMLTAFWLQGIREAHSGKRFIEASNVIVASSEAAYSKLRLLGYASSSAAFRVKPDDPLREKYDAIKIGDVVVTPSQRLQGLEPRVGRCYVANEALVPAVRLYRERRPDVALEALQQLIAAKGTDAETAKLARHMAINVAQLHGGDAVILDNAKAILAENPTDTHALFVLALYCAYSIQTKQAAVSAFNPGGADTLESSEAWKALNESSQSLAQLLQRIANDIKNAWDSNGQPRDVLPVDEIKRKSWPGQLVVGICGWGPILQKEGHLSPLPPLQQRIDAASELAQAFPTALIIASGGGVSSEVIEGEFIRGELERLDAHLKTRIVVDPLARDSVGNGLFISKWMRDKVDGNKTLFIVASDWQIPRFKLIMQNTMKGMGVDAQLVLVGAGNAVNADQTLLKQIQSEQSAIWRDAARSLGFFEYCDFEKAKLNGSNNSGITTTKSDALAVAKVARAWMLALMATFTLMPHL